MKLKLLACDVLVREISHCIARCPNTIYPAFTAKGEHNVSDRLRANLQGQIDSAETDGVAYDAILLGYGLCGNSTHGLQARSFPLIVPRAHDCTTLFLGSKESFEEHFGANPSQGWTSVGYSERGGGLVSDGATRGDRALDPSYMDMVAQYGEESALYLWETLHPQKHSDEIFFIDVPETRNADIKAHIRAEAEELGKPLRELPGSLRLIDALLAGQWDAADFLIVPPGHRIAGVYDHQQVMAAEPVS